MSDKEIIDALEHCMKAACKNCPMFIKDNQSYKGIQIFDVVVLINRLKAEIEGLKKIQQTQADRLIEERGQKYEQIEVISKLKKQLETTKFEVERNRRIIQDHETIIEMLEKEFKTTKSETIREFAERAKEVICSYVNAEGDIDQIVEEMIGEM